MTAKRSQAPATIVTNPQSTQPLMLAANLPPAYVGTAWSGSVWGVGGAGGNVYSSITVPAWATAVTVTILGVPFVSITGTPTGGTLGSNVVTVTVTDSSSTVTTKQFRFNVTYTISGAGGQLSANAVPPPAYTNNPYSLDLKTYLNNPTLPLTSTVLTSGTLPTGMTLHSVTGIIDASSVTGTTQSVVLTVTDGASAVAVLHLQLRVKPGLSASTYAPAGVIGQPYQGKVTVSGGSGKYSVQALAVNPLPTGIVVEAKSGKLSGQPTTLTPTTGAPTTHFQITDLVTGEIIITTALGGGSKSISINSSVPPAKPGHFFTGSSTGALADVDYFSQFFGDGSDGTLTASSGTTQLSRDTFYSNVTLSGTAVLDLNGFTLYVSDTLDITAAGAGAIISKTNVTGFAWGGVPGTSSAGGATTGVAGGDAQSLLGIMGGDGRRGGSGGSGTSGGGGIAGQAGGRNAVVRSPDWVHGDFYYGNPNLLLTQGVFPLCGGLGGSAGGSGGGNGSAGGASGAGGYGGPRISIFARRINRGGSTAAGCIDASGKVGANGTAGAAAGRGGGGAGAGGSGGGLRLVFSELLGSTATNALRANGGNGGDGGNAGGVGATAGAGGDGGNSGAILKNDVLTPAFSLTTGTTGSAASGQTHGAGGVCQANL